MQEFCVEITWWCNRERFEYLADVASVIPAVGENVEKDLLPGHAASIAVGECESQNLRQSRRREVENVVSVPGIRGFDIGSELLERRSRFRIRSVERPRLPTEVGTKDSVNDVDVVQGAHARVKLFGMRWRKRGQEREQLRVGPGFVAEERFQSFGGHD